MGTKDSDKKLFSLYLLPGLYRRLQRLAKKNDMSMNRYITSIIKDSVIVKPLE